MYFFCVNIKVFDDFALDHSALQITAFNSGARYISFGIHHIAVIAIMRISSFARQAECVRAAGASVGVRRRLHDKMSQPGMRSWLCTISNCCCCQSARAACANPRSRLMRPHLRGSQNMNMPVVLLLTLPLA